MSSHCQPFQARNQSYSFCLPNLDLYVLRENLKWISVSLTKRYIHLKITITLSENKLSENRVYLPSAVDSV